MNQKLIVEALSSVRRGSMYKDIVNSLRIPVENIVNFLVETPGDDLSWHFFYTRLVVESKQKYRHVLLIIFVCPQQRHSVL